VTGDWAAYAMLTCVLSVLPVQSVLSVLSVLSQILPPHLLLISCNYYGFKAYWPHVVNHLESRNGSIEILTNEQHVSLFYVGIKLTFLLRCLFLEK